MSKNKKILLAVAVSILILFMGGKYLFAMAQRLDVVMMSFIG
ncbi:hypothetical protein [Priestia flexa]|nr:hypothetical protein [Priestia flexa]